MSAREALAIGVDVGGTKIAAGVVDVDGTVLAETQQPTPASDGDAVERAVVDCVELLRRSHDVSAVGVAAPGFVSADRARVLFTPNVAWRDRPLRDGLERELGIDVVVENDANAAAWAEYRFGAGRGHRDVVLVILGTGVGGGVVTDGRLVRGSAGFAGEIGHVQRVPGGRPCGCGREGCWEQYITGKALVLQAHVRASADPRWSAGLLAAAGGTPAGITGPLITELAHQGDGALVELLADHGRLVGEFCAALVAVLDPEVVVIGGGVSSAGDLLMTPLQVGFARSVSPRGFPRGVGLVAAQLGNEAGLVGAADLARTV